jgi:hypothetical protein
VGLADVWDQIPIGLGAQGASDWKGAWINWRWRGDGGLGGWRRRVGSDGMRNFLDSMVVDIVPSQCENINEPKT